MQTNGIPSHDPETNSLIRLIGDFLEMRGEVTFNAYSVDVSWKFHEWEWSHCAIYSSHDDDPVRALKYVHGKMQETIRDVRRVAAESPDIQIDDLVRLTEELQHPTGGAVLPGGTMGTVQGGLMNFWPRLVPVLTEYGSVLIPPKFLDKIIIADSAIALIEGSE